MVVDPLLGGTGGLEEECRLWWAYDVKEATAGVVERVVAVGEEVVEQVRATRRREWFSIAVAVRNLTATSRGEVRSR